VNNLFVDVINDFSLEQQVFEPTRNENVLDLVLTTSPYLIDNIKVVPGMSDYEAVICNLQNTSNNNSHITYIFHKAHTELMPEDVRSFKDLFFQSDPNQRLVEDNWNYFKDMIFEMMNKNIPSRIAEKLHG